MLAGYSAAADCGLHCLLKPVCLNTKGKYGSGVKQDMMRNKQNYHIYPTYGTFAPCHTVLKFEQVHLRTCRFVSTLCMLGNFACFLVICGFFFFGGGFFFKLLFSKQIFRNTISVKQFGSRSDPTFCRA